MVDNETKAWLDWFEGVSDKLYGVKTIDLRENKTGQIHQAYAYVLEDFRDDLLNDDTIFLENYSSKNMYFPEYEKFDDDPENTYSLLKQLKKDFNQTKI